MDKPATWTSSVADDADAIGVLQIIENPSGGSAKASLGV